MTSHNGDIYFALQRALSEAQATDGDAPSVFNGIQTSPLNTVDLHGLHLSEAQSEIENHLRVAFEYKLPAIKFVHGYRSGTTIRQFLWRSIAENRWPKIVPKCSQPNLIQYLEKFESRDYRNGEFQTSVPALGMYYKEFEFRSGSTTIPLEFNVTRRDQ